MSLNSGETLQPFKPLNQLIYDSAGNLIGIQNDRANGSDLRIGGGSGVDGTFATLIATTALKLNSGAVFELYNTADQITNYERLRADWSGNVARIYTQAAGTGVVRGLALGSGTSTLSSGTFTAVAVNPTINQSGTAGYILADFNATETATGSGTKLLQRWAVGGISRAQMDSGGAFWSTIIVSTGGVQLGTTLGTAGDVHLNRDAADTLALRRDTNAQTFRVYNTYTDGSNYERGIAGWISNTYAIGTFNAGTGANRPIGFYTNSLARWVITADGHFLANDDNTYDIGASGANRPRNVYIGGSTVIGAFHTVGVSTVAALPAAAGAARAQIFVSDSSVAAAGNFGAIVVGGGANIVPVFCDGTNWRIG